ncbi:MAG: NAD(P)/FAD-dependent oxidoreductase [Anaerolineales bacterium]|nr:NAD(P)/FAD-dependent oxidoreductase [Anaerolineales bacterium]
MDYDVIIIGARVAGAILSSLLGEGGHRVLALDRATFPSDTLSTHFFRAPAFRAFHQIGVFDEVQATAPNLTVNYNVIDGIVFPEPVDRPEDYPFYMCIRRITLDAILVRRARKTPNVELREGAVAKGLLREGDRVIGVRWKEANQKNEATAKVIVGADGLRSFVAKEVGVQAEHEEPVNRAMYFAYYRGMEAKEGPAAEFHYRGNNLAYCFPCDNDLTLLAVSVPIEQFKEFKRDPEGKLLSEFEAMPDLGTRLKNAEREGPVQGTGSIPGYLRIPYGNGWALVGDAGMVMDPWSGQGIDQASTHAVYLAEHLGNHLTGKQDWETAMKAYHQARNEFSLKAYRRTCKLSVDFTPMTRAALERRGFV